MENGSKNYGKWDQKIWKVEQTNMENRKKYGKCESFCFQNGLKNMGPILETGSKKYRK